MVNSGGGTVITDVNEIHVESTTEHPMYESTTPQTSAYPMTMMMTTTLNSDIDDTVEIEASPPPPADCGGRLFIPHKSDCTKYYLCNFGKISEYSCPPGLYWNENRCDWPENTKCKNAQRQVRGISSKTVRLLMSRLDKEIRRIIDRIASDLSRESFRRSVNRASRELSRPQAAKR